MVVEGEENQVTAPLCLSPNHLVVVVEPACLTGSMNDQVVTSHNQARSRFEAHVSGELASYLEYRRNGSIHDLVHTYTLDAFKGRGIATTLTGFALASIRESGGSIIPSCWFVAEYVAKHPNYADLVHD